MTAAAAAAGCSTATVRWHVDRLNRDSPVKADLAPVRFLDASTEDAEALTEYVRLTLQACGAREAPSRSVTGV